MKDIKAGIRFPGLSVSGVSRVSNPVVSAIAFVYLPVLGLLALATL